MLLNIYIFRQKSFHNNFKIQTHVCLEFCTPDIYVTSIFKQVI